MSLSPRSALRSMAVLLALVACACLAPAERPAARSTCAAASIPHVTHGVAAGEVTSTSAVIWARCDAAGSLHIALQQLGHGREASATTTVRAQNDFTGKLRFEGLAPDITYEYRAWCSRSDSNGSESVNSVDGVLHTAPDARDPKAVAFAWGGDLGGQNVCRDRDDGYSILRVIKDRGFDFFIGLGDMIYADDPCAAKGRYGNDQIPGPAAPSMELSGFWAYWKYNRDDAALRALLAAVPYYAVWDDHEVLNDFGPHHDTGPVPPYPVERHLMPLGLQAFLDYNPLIDSADTPKRLHRRLRWGKHLELFILDTRQYRDSNFEADDPKHPKTMLGLEQLRWLKEGLQRSDATWKVIVSSVPMSVPTGSERGRDGWANFDQRTGFEYELLDILRFMQSRGIRNSVWVTTDAHFGAVFRYTPFADDPAFQVHEVITGPLNAGVFTQHVFDTTLGTERLFLFGPNDPGAVRSFAEERAWFNFGVIRVDAGGVLALAIVAVEGRTVYELPLRPR